MFCEMLFHPVIQVWNISYSVNKTLQVLEKERQLETNQYLTIISQ